MARSTWTGNLYHQSGLGRRWKEIRKLSRELQLVDFLEVRWSRFLIFSWTSNVVCDLLGTSLSESFCVFRFFASFFYLLTSLWGQGCKEFFIQVQISVHDSLGWLFDFSLFYLVLGVSAEPRECVAMFSLLSLLWLPREVCFWTPWLCSSLNRYSISCNAVGVELFALFASFSTVESEDPIHVVSDSKIGNIALTWRSSFPEQFGYHVSVINAVLLGSNQTFTSFRFVS